jgi:hypothetical protein
MKPIAETIEEKKEITELACSYEGPCRVLLSIVVQTGPSSNWEYVLDIDPAQWEVPPPKTRRGKSSSHDREQRPKRLPCGILRRAARLGYRRLFL